jgi:hypothetical protein
MFVSLAIALVALGLAIGCWFRPSVSSKASSPPAAPVFTGQQTADAKAKVCAAFGQVDRALNVAQSFGGSTDQMALLTVATSTRQALDFGSRYLSTKLAEEPATPPDLATAVRKQSDAYQQLMIGYLDGLRYGDADLQPAVNASQGATSDIQRLCK